MKYDTIIIKLKDSSEIIECQKKLFDIGFLWRSGTSNILYSDRNNIVIYVNISNKKLSRGNILELDSYIENGDILYLNVGKYIILDYNEWDKIYTIIRNNGLLPPSYRPKKIKRTFEKLNEGFDFYRNNDDISDLNLKYSIGEYVILKPDALKIHLEYINGIFGESQNTIDKISKQIGKKLKIKEIARHIFTDKFFLELTDENNITIYISINSVTKKPYYTKKKTNKRIIESLFSGESDFRVWCNTTEKSIKFEQLLYDWGWKWKSSFNIRFNVNDPMTFLFFFDIEKFDSYSFEKSDGLDLLKYPEDLSKIFNKFNKSPIYEPKNKNKRIL